MHPDVATSLNNLALLYYTQGQYAQAEPLYQRALAIREQTLAPMHPDVGTSLHNLATLYCAQGQYAQAESLYQRALAIRDQTLGSMHPNVALSGCIQGCLTSPWSAQPTRDVFWQCQAGLWVGRRAPGVLLPAHIQLIGANMWDLPGQSICGGN